MILATLMSGNSDPKMMPAIVSITKLSQRIVDGETGDSLNLISPMSKKKLKFRAIVVWYSINLRILKIMHLPYSILSMR